MLISILKFNISLDIKNMDDIEKELLINTQTEDIKYIHQRN